MPADIVPDLKENTELGLAAEFPRALREARPLLYLLDGLNLTAQPAHPDEAACPP